MIDKKTLIVGQAIQDQELAAIRNTWEQTSINVKEEFVRILESRDTKEIAAFFSIISPEWSNWILTCVLCGLRQALFFEKKETNEN